MLYVNVPGVRSGGRGVGVVDVERSRSELPRPFKQTSAQTNLVTSAINYDRYCFIL